MTVFECVIVVFVACLLLLRVIDGCLLFFVVARLFDVVVDWLSVVVDGLFV